MKRQNLINDSILWSRIKDYATRVGRVSDIISSQRLPIIGWLDEVAALSVAFKGIRKHITPEMEHNVDVLLDKWFPIYSSYEIVY